MHSSAYLVLLLFLDFLISSIDSQLISIQYYNKINVALQNVLIFGQENMDIINILTFLICITFIQKALPTIWLIYRLRSTFRTLTLLVYLSA